jgi:hypothetical protein
MSSFDKYGYIYPDLTLGYMDILLWLSEKF